MAKWTSSKSTTPGSYYSNISKYSTIIICGAIPFNSVASASGMCDRSLLEIVCPDINNYYIAFKFILIISPVTVSVRRAAALGIGLNIYHGFTGPHRHLLKDDALLNGSVTALQHFLERSSLEVGTLFTS